MNSERDESSDGIVERMKTEFGRNVRCYGRYMYSPYLLTQNILYSQ